MKATLMKDNLKNVDDLKSETDIKDGPTKMKVTSRIVPTPKNLFAFTAKI